MIIPKTIKVGNIVYKIVLKKLKTEFGTHDAFRQKIIIGNDLTKEMTRNTFIHELVHAMLFQIGAYKESRDEILVQSLANEIDKLFELKP